MSLQYRPLTDLTPYARNPSGVQIGRPRKRETWRHVADQLRKRWPKLAELMDSSEADVLAYMTFPAQHRTKLHSTNPLERLTKEVKRRADVVGIFPNEESITRLIDAVLFEQNDEWQTQHRYMHSLEIGSIGLTRRIPAAAEAVPAQLPTDRGGRAAQRSSDAIS